MAGPLSGKIALVTGASSGIGEASAIALAEAGASVAVSARRADRLTGLVARIEAAGGTALALPGDVAIEADAVAAVESTIAHFGRIDILINSAGILAAGGIEAASTEEYRRVIDVNLMGTVYTCKAALGPMKAQGAGDIVNISSQAGKKATPGMNAYGASKHALNAMTDSMRQEVGGFGIRMCCLMPGATATEVASGVSDPVARAAMHAHVTKDGAVTAGEIAAGVLFVVSMPRHVNIDLISMRPTIDTSA
jgi:NADP-dependent 3-hydroxy acid dehydrogenase YdfG